MSSLGSQVRAVGCMCAFWLACARSREGGGRRRRDREEDAPGVLARLIVPVAVCVTVFNAVQQSHTDVACDAQHLDEISACM